MLKGDSSKEGNYETDDGKTEQPVVNQWDVDPTICLTNLRISLETRKACRSPLSVF